MSSEVLSGNEAGETHNKPVQRFKAGSVVATVWANETNSKIGEGGVFYTVSLDRVYKDKSGDWKYAGSLRINDLPRAELVLRKAYEWLSMTEPQ